MKDYSYIFNAQSSYIEELYERYKRNPEQMEPGWRVFFEGFDFAAKSNGMGAAVRLPEEIDISEFGVLSIIHGFRDRGHLLSTTNPIRERLDRKPHLDLNDYGLDESHLDESFQAGREIGMEEATLREIIDRLKTIYCGNIGFEYTHILDRERRMWLRDKIENRSLNADFGLPIEKKKRILDKLNGAVVFERFLHTKYIGQKRFSLEGGETTIAALDAMINHGSKHDVREYIIGMAHRGRLNVLANIMGKTYEQIFTEFEGTAVPDMSFGDGDVKYHLGFSSQVETMYDKTVDLKLVPNPSHLESVDPVVEGFSRAKADLLYDSEFSRIMPILLHGDSAITGQGVVYETAQLSKLPGYFTGGTMHYIINNQIGFTTDFDEARSSTYSSDVAKVIQAPVFHVNGDDPEAVIFATELAVEYRQKFHSDVFIDMVCYRKHGHNEGDDPKFTQPRMYQIIKEHPDPREVYSRKLSERGDIEKQIAENMEDEFWGLLQDRLDQVKEKTLPYQYQDPELDWKHLRFTSDPKDFKESPVTGIDQNMVESIIDHLLRYPEDFKPVEKMNRLLKSMRKMRDQDKFNWSLGEMLAYGSLLLEGHDVRMSGQDSKRGTFSHRHAIFHDKNDFSEWNRLNHLGEDQGRFMIYNSILSEFAVLGFEYGYSLSTPNTLVLWEAQFGDFNNGAQVIIDQYIIAAESKWRRMSGLVMLLPHGYEGQGPEHSSARLERFLQMSAEFNMTVANITTPANFFHALRRQLARPFRKPLIVMSPKSLLRHPGCVSRMEEFTGETSFQELFDDPAVDTKKKAKDIRRVLYCSGKIYYELLEYKEEHEHEDVAIVRLEQLYPLPLKQLKEIEKKYGDAERYWVQEEPSNMGAWQYMNAIYTDMSFELLARKSSASPATGFKKIHDRKQENILKRAFAESD